MFRSVDTRGETSFNGLDERWIHVMERPHVQFRTDSPGAREPHPSPQVQPLMRLPRLSGPERRHKVLPTQHEQPHRVERASGSRSRSYILTR